VFTKAISVWIYVLHTASMYSLLCFHVTCSPLSLHVLIAMFPCHMFSIEPPCTHCYVSMSHVLHRASMYSLLCFHVTCSPLSLHVLIAMFLCHMFSIESPSMYSLLCFYVTCSPLSLPPCTHCYWFPGLMFSRRSVCTSRIKFATPTAPRRSQNSRLLRRLLSNY